MRESMIAAATGGAGNLAAKGVTGAKYAHTALVAIDKGRDAVDAAEAVIEGNYLGAAMTAAGMMPSGSGKAAS